MDSHPEKKWKCHHCSWTFKGKGDFDRHLMTHDPNAKVKCKICGKILKNPATLSAHMSHMHTRRIRPACNICKGTFSNLAHLRRHIDNMHPTKERPRLPCGFPGCEKTFRNKDQIPCHIKTEHVENPVRFPCALCGKEFKARSQLGQHISSHTTEKPFKCATCGKKFGFLGYMKNHEKTHIQKPDRKIFKCQLCLQTFVARANLQGHIRVIHENQRNYRCTFCDKSFGHPSALKSHMEWKRHTDEETKIYSCDKCEYKSHSKVYLAQHVRRHHIEKRHECYFCKKQFATFNELVGHCCRVHTLEK
ncbi:zinc finger protein 83-like [Folsomia candida]|uniref:zinc finger protein 83-like n=1 Tax=Folsomia candida TaxID=158441 RepID=UPI00160524D3|nr:zinc finger protein 83-like [Folsomia candida]